MFRSSPFFIGWALALSGKTEQFSYEMRISGIGEGFCRNLRLHPYCGMIFLGWLPKVSNRCGNIYGADFFSPKIVFGHKCETPERAKSAGISNAPPRFLIYLAVQSSQG